MKTLINPIYDETITEMIEMLVGGFSADYYPRLVKSKITSTPRISCTLDGATDNNEESRITAPCNNYPRDRCKCTLRDFYHYRQRKRGATLTIHRNVRLPRTFQTKRDEIRPRAPSFGR